jgi:uncharacterized membrane protein
LNSVQIAFAVGIHNLAGKSKNCKFDGYCFHKYFIFSIWGCMNFCQSRVSLKFRFSELVLIARLEAN